MKKAFLYTALIISISIILSSCKGGVDGKDKEVTIKFSTFLEEGAQADAYKEIIGMFEESHKNIKINLMATANGYDAALNDALKGGKGPDIMGLQRTKMIDYINKGYIKDISEWVNTAGLKDKYYGVSLGYGKYDGKYYGIGDLPYTVEWYYNKKVFKNAGIDEPKNMDELLDACKKLKRYVKYPIIIGAKDAWSADVAFGAISVQTINTEKLAKAYASGNRAEFENLNGAEDALDILYDLAKAGAISSKVEDIDYAQSVNEFVNGRAAIFPMGSWASKKIEDVMPEGFDYGVFESPIEFVSSPESKVSATAVHVITVNEKSAHPKEAMEFLNFLFSEEAQKVLAKKNGISGFKSVNSSSDDEIKDRILEHLDMTDENSTMYVDDISNEMMEATRSGILKIINKDMEPKQAYGLIIDQTFTK
jgi:raffinose/stachyose/melibiose transport system substrate-binding protein